MTDNNNISQWNISSSPLFSLFPASTEEQSPASNSDKNNVRSNRNNHLYDSSRVVSSSFVNNYNPKFSYHRRKLISEQALRSRLSTLDRSTLLEEFIRYFQFYYTDHHNQNGDNQSDNGESNHKYITSNHNNNNQENREASIVNSAPVTFSEASNGHNSYSNNFNNANKYSRETGNSDEDYYND